MSSEKFCLRWNDFESNISGAFRELRDDKDFFDVTIACEDEQMQAHKVILSACSPFFRNILRRNSHQHPLLYLKGVKYTDLQSVLNFMYHGEVNVAQEELNSFLAVAEDLRVKGLTQNQGNPSASRPREKSPPRINKPRIIEREPPPPPKRPKPPQPPAAPQTFSPIPAPSQSFASDDDIQELPPVKTEPREAPAYPAPAVPTNNAPPQMEHQIVEQDQSAEQYGEEGAMGEYEDYGQYGDSSYDESQYSHSVVPADGGKGSISIEERPAFLDQHIEKVLDEGTYKKQFMCRLCNKVHAQKIHCQNHLESIHFPEMFIYSCSHCGKTFNGRNKLYVHISLTHKA
eukprot:GFUD01037048.1.p1 GENE.GFUD01037048.1~~GFUD01037048.1.p1  ORF type:complete len:344 (+),score=63.75 GFUD01037048.1:88-1119(+)